MKHPRSIYEAIQKAALQYAKQGNAQVERFQLGLTWSSCRITADGQASIGFAMSPHDKTRLLQWPGTVAGKPVDELTTLLHSWNGFDATLGLAACNAVINSPSNPLMQQAQVIPATEDANLAVFRYFRPKLTNKKVVVIGRYPHMDSVLGGLNYTVLERQPQADDLPDSAAEFVIPEADWVFITATSLINKTFGRLSELAKNAVTVLMGPTTPWLPEFADYDIDFMAGVLPTDIDKAEQIAMEGGGTRLFERGVHYAVANIANTRLQALKKSIGETVTRRDQLKQAMEAWYQAGNASRFGQWQELEATDAHLSKLDSAYKRLWDACQ
ncbi:DUF364 domain-containing protein [Halioxenophilus sp. WMMB6]|uniref:DUF364 domain-containing protein n=1 Tax=Halioxenophilus sp. WMMB6 TaxID=3073815 RepID=UPI00295EEAEF|nr:DUF364 domain-containing protein [Halioxenophilus sp. WMMB6]